MPEATPFASCQVTLTPDGLVLQFGSKSRIVLSQSEARSLRDQLTLATAPMINPAYAHYFTPEFTHELQAHFYQAKQAALQRP